MPNLPISGLPTADALDGSELVAVVQAGTTKQTTTQDIANLAAGGSVGYVIARGAVDESGGAINLWVGIDSVDWDCGQPGTYTVHFTPDFFGSRPTVVATCDRTEGSFTCNVGNITLTQCMVYTTQVGGDQSEDIEFNIIAIGPAGPPL